MIYSIFSGYTYKIKEMKNPKLKIFDNYQLIIHNLLNKMKLEKYWQML
jgi:hypothetical protein